MAVPSGYARTLPYGQEPSEAKAPAKNMLALAPALACLFSTVVAPLIIFFANDAKGTGAIQSINRMVWPALAVIGFVVAFQNRSRLSQIQLTPVTVFLLAYLSLAGASVVWAFKPDLSLLRFTRQVFVIIAITLPALLCSRRSDLLKWTFLCYALAAPINFYCVFQNSPGLVASLNGYPGYFTGKNYLGQFAAVALILSFNELRYTGMRKALGILVLIMAALLLVWSNSKTAFGLALLLPIIAGVVLTVSRWTRLSPALQLFTIAVGYLIFTNITGISSYRIAYMIYGDSTLTGRTIIWAFVDSEIAMRPLLGWGYQSFWLVGPNGPGIVHAPGWVATMPNSHDGYRDVTLELGYVGLTILYCFILATLHAIGRIAEQDAIRGWVLLSLALLVVSYNFLESFWFSGYEFIWILFLIVVAESIRYPRASAGGQKRHTERSAARAQEPGRYSAMRG